MFKICDLQILFKYGYRKSGTAEACCPIAPSTLQKISFLSTLVEGHWNNLLGKHCREIRQTVYWWKVTRLHGIVVMVICLTRVAVIYRNLTDWQRLYSFHGGSYNTQIWLAVWKIKTIAIRLAWWWTCNVLCFIKTFINDLYICVK